MRNIKKHKKLFIALGIIFSICILLVSSFFIYVGTYYKADKSVEAALMTNENVQVNETKKWIEFRPAGKIEQGLIFYPGAKVDSKAYEPLLSKLANQGIFCVLLQMPFHLAIFDVDAATAVIKGYPEVTSWSIAGHSLGGAMASVYASKHNEITSVILLAAYSTKDISDKKVLSIYGTKDEVLNQGKYEKNKSNLPQEMIEVVIEGGCHAYFGVYGQQKNDGIPTIHQEEQQEITKEAILDFLKW